MRSGKSLLLDNFNEYFINEDDEIEPLIYLPYVNKINILIGTNNSGKSKFMRKLMDFKTFKYINEWKVDSFNRMIKTSYPRAPKLKRSQSIEDDIRNYVRNGYLVNYDVKSYLEIISEIKNPKVYYIPTLRSAHTLYQEIKKEENRYNSDKEYIKIEDIL